MKTAKKRNTSKTKIRRKTKQKKTIIKECLQKAKELLDESGMSAREQRLFIAKMMEEDAMLEKRDVSVTFRVTKQEYADFKKIKKMDGLTISSILINSFYSRYKNTLY